MKAKYLVAAAMVLAMNAWAAPQDVYSCNEKIKSIYGTMMLRCGENVSPLAMRMFNFIDQDGRPFVARASVLASVQCEGGVCAEVTSNGYGEPMGTAPDERYYVQRGYYLGADSSGQLVAYRMGTGPAYGGAVAQNAAASNGLTGEACYEQKMAAFRQENGEEAMIIHDQINEWEGQCGLPLSE